MRIFVDIGAHYGESLAVALDPRWAFDRVYSLEPSRAAYRVLARNHDTRLKTERIGLSNSSRNATLYGAGQLGGSVYADKKQKTDHLRTEIIELVKATDWFRKNIPEGSTVFVKLNCEGSEVDILEDLLDSGEVAKVAAFYVDFDIRKVPSQAHREDEVTKRLRESGVRFLSTADMNLNANWGLEQALHWVFHPKRPALAKRLSHSLHSYAPPYDRAKLVLSKLLPRQIYWALGRRFGRAMLSRS